MKLSEFRQYLNSQDGLGFSLPDGSHVPAHFHVTEIGMATKQFIDCGGTNRKEHHAVMQLWSSIDLHHRLKAETLAGIIDKAEVLFNGLDPEVEIEYQQETIGRFGLAVEEGSLYLKSLQTDCLAQDQCGITGKVQKALSSLSPDACTPGSGCC